MATETSKLAVAPAGTAPHAPVKALKDPVAPAALAHLDIVQGPFWQRIPAYASISEAEFLDHKFQAKNSITKISKLLDALQGLVAPEFIKDAEAGFARAPMSVRVSPY